MSKRCQKCGKEMDYIKTKTSESWFCYNCNHGIIKPRLWIGRFWNFLYGLKYFFMDFRTVMKRRKEKLEEKE
jgi:DNA-directed RNA polymerase subunit RPC12/RpoP